LCTVESKAWQTSSDEEREVLARQLWSLTVPALVDVLRHVLPEHGDREGATA
jgi:hypothetical protein